MTCPATRPCLSTRHLDFFALNFMRAQETLSPSADRTHLACIWVVVVTARSSIKPLIDASGEPWYACLLYRCIYICSCSPPYSLKFALPTLTYIFTSTCSELVNCHCVIFFRRHKTSLSFFPAFRFCPFPPDYTEKLP